MTSKRPSTSMAPVKVACGNENCRQYGVVKFISTYADTHATDEAFCPACEGRLYHMKEETLKEAQARVQGCPHCGGFLFYDGPTLRCRDCGRPANADDEFKAKTDANMLQYQAFAGHVCVYYQYLKSIGAFDKLEDGSRMIMKMIPEVLIACDLMRPTEVKK